MIFEKQILGMYKGMMYSRCDGSDTIFYFSADDFPGLLSEPYSFKSSEGNALKGYFYCYENPISGKLIVFDHGFGGGHKAYMKEIEMLCRKGYTVFSYDHTGCMESEGDGCGGLSHSLSDLNDCISALKKEERFASCDISVIGHSWGGFSALNITALHPEISHIVVLSGFVSAKEMISTFFGGILKGYRKAVLALESKENPYYSTFDAVETLSRSNARALLIYSENDPMCKKKHYDILKKGLGDKENISFMLLKNKGHNPNYTEEALKLLDKFSKERAKVTRNKNLSKEFCEEFIASFDFHKMTEQDETVWNEIFEHLENRVGS
ncbi:MAG: alpha/beta fold hydrolase [Clostridia bacterium]|nr:alpha/beta fold hydrolase [Clostridia bacterium]